MGLVRERDRGAYVLAAILMASSVAHAETSLELGAYGGLTSSKPLTYSCLDLLGGDPCGVTASEPHYSKTGFTAGAYARYLFLPLLVETNLLYVQKGVKDGPNGTRTTHHYIELPLLIGFDAFRAASAARVFLLAGVAPAIRVGCTVTGPIFDNDTHMAVNFSGACRDLPTVLARDPNWFDLSVVVGPGIGWDTTFGTVEIQARYTHGLIDTRDDDGGKTINRTLMLMAGFGFGFAFARE